MLRLLPRLLVVLLALPSAPTMLRSAESPVVADSCRMVIDRRFLIEEDVTEVKEELRAVLDRVANTRPGFRYNLRDLFEVIPSMTDKDAPVARATAAAIRRVLQREPAFICSPGSYDQKAIILFTNKK